MLAIRAVLCDLGGVVIRIDPDRIRSGWARLSTLAADDVYSAYPDDVYASFERDEVTDHEYLEHVRRQLCLRGTDEEIRAAFNDLFLGVDENTIGVLRRLRERGVLLLALTNTNRAHQLVWSRRFADALEVFDDVHCSHDLGCRKPEPEVFRRVLEAHRLPASGVVFIDDLEGHVDAARAAGLQAVKFTDAATLQDQLDTFEWATSDAS